MQPNTTVSFVTQTVNKHGEDVDSTTVTLPARIVEKSRSSEQGKNRKANHYDLRLLVHGYRIALYVGLLTCKFEIEEDGERYKLQSVTPHFDFSGKVLFHELRLVRVV